MVAFSGHFQPTNVTIGLCHLRQLGLLHFVIQNAYFDWSINAFPELTRKKFCWTKSVDMTSLIISGSKQTTVETDLVTPYYFVTKILNKQTYCLGKFSVVFYLILKSFLICLFPWVWNQWLKFFFKSILDQSYVLFIERSKLLCTTPIYCCIREK